MKLLFSHIAFIIILIGFSLNGVSQDLIVTTDLDSLNCRITKVKKDYIYFTFKYENEIRNTLLPTDKIQQYKQNYFQTAEVPENQTIRKGTSSHFRLSVNGGYSRRIAETYSDIPEEFSDYVNKLKSGFHFGGEAHYFISEAIGLGIDYTSFMASNKMNNIYVVDRFGNKRYGELSDDISISFIAPSLSVRFLNGDKKNALLLNFAVGYMSYLDNAVVVDSYKLTSNTLGTSLTIGYDIGLTENIAIGFQLTMLTGTLHQFTTDNGYFTETIELEKDEYESLNRIDLSIGIRLIK